MRHPSDRQLIRYLTGLAGRRDRTETARHLASCDACTGRAESLDMILSPSQNRALKPPARVQRALLAALAAEIEISGKNYTSGFSIKGVFRFKPALAAAAAVIVITGAVFVHIAVKQHRTLPVTISYLRGSVYINGDRIKKESPIYKDSFIRVTKNAALVLTFQNSLTIRIRGESLFRIHRSGKNQKNSLMGYVFEIRKGTLFASVTAGRKGPYFCYLTPSVSIQSHKSDFMLKVGESDTTIIPREGSLQATALGSKIEMELRPEKKYIITSSIEPFNLDKEDEKNTDSMKNIGTPMDDADDPSAGTPLEKI